MDAFYADKLGDDWMKGHIFCTSQGKYRTAPSGITIGDASSKMAEYVQGGRDGLDSMLRMLYTSPVEATFLWRELQIAKGKSAGQLKPVRIISNEDQRRFFFIMWEM